ncbi:MAG: ABC transporter ATP-binding protein [Gammaproteobacteria bacterium]|nr:ABC transporter ATP-binding protein [Gammaproteobacteria bacterium]
MMPEPGVPALCLADVVKRFGDLIAVDRLNLRLARGEFYALLGPNGAGKTTTLRLISGLLRPDAGRVEILGVDAAQAPERAKRPLAFVPDEPPLYGKLRLIEYLEFVAGLWAVPADAAMRRADELLGWLELDAARRELCENLSRGMQQKLALAAALIHDPQVLVLDEPLTGLDAHAARRVKDHLLALTRRGLTVLFSTHILDVAEKLAGRIGVIQHGRLLAEGRLDQLRARYGGASLEDVFLNATAAGS